MKKQHAINIVLPLALLLVFAVCAVAVLLFAADVYSETVSASALNDSSRTAVSYISEKIHRCDENVAVSIGSFDGCDSILIMQEYEGRQLCTYIYRYGDSLMELVAQPEAGLSADFGTEICRVSDFSMQQLSECVFRFSCTDISGESSAAIVSVKSKA